MIQRVSDFFSRKSSPETELLQSRRAEFKDPELEGAYRQSRLGDHLQQLRIFMIIGVVATVYFIPSDTLFYSRDRLTRTQLKKIDTHLKSMYNQLSFESIIYSHVLRELVNKESKYNGYTYADITKLFYTIQLILYYAQREVYKMAILKLLFYIDFSHFKKKEKSITGWPYANLPFGPVPEDYKRILFQGEEREMFFTEPDETEMGELYRLPDDFSAEGVLGFFSKEEIETIQEVVEKLGKRTATSLVQLTHRESAWTESARAELISYHYASRLKAV